MSKFRNVLLATMAVIGVAALEDEKNRVNERIARNTIGVLNIPESKLLELRHCRIQIQGSRISYVDKDSWIQSSWSLPFASFRGFSGKAYSFIKIEDCRNIGPDAVLQCRTNKGMAYINIHATR